MSIRARWVDTANKGACNVCNMGHNHGVMKVMEVTWQITIGWSNTMRFCAGCAKQTMRVMIIPLKAERLRFGE